MSGTGLAQSFFDEILRPVLEAIGLSEPQFEVIQTKSVESIIGFAKSSLLRGANEGRSQTVVLLSGDGGVVDIINGLLEKGKRSRYQQLLLHELLLRLAFSSMGSYHC